MATTVNGTMLLPTFFVVAGIIDVLKDISFEIDQGEFVFILGNSAQKKSCNLQLLNIISFQMFLRI